MIYEVLSADRFTPYALAKKFGAKAILESANFSTGKDRYSMIMLDEAFRVIQDDDGIALIINGQRRPVYAVKNGDILEFTKDAAKVLDTLDLKEILVDGLGIGDVSGNIISERKIMANSGVVIASLCFLHGTNRLISSPTIITKGFISKKQSSTLNAELIDVVASETSRLINQSIQGEWFTSNIERVLKEYIFEKTMRKPLVIVNVTEAVI